MCAGSNESTTSVVVEGYGARLAVSASDPELLQRTIDELPPGWGVCAPPDAQTALTWRFAVQRERDGYRIHYGEGDESHCTDLATVVRTLRLHMRRYVGHHTRDLVFIHAGVVAHRGRAILLPGRSFAGKSTLVAALVRAGAEYYSDEYAILDSRGLVSQYLDPMVLRGPGGREEIADGPIPTRSPAPVGLVALTAYERGSTWSPRTLTAGSGVVATMEHAVPARDRPGQTLATLRLALAHATILQGERGEADATAGALLETVEAAP